jgi:hypothetical protein
VMNDLDGDRCYIDNDMNNGKKAFQADNTWMICTIGMGVEVKTQKIILNSLFLTRDAIP